MLKIENIANIRVIALSSILLMHLFSFFYFTEFFVPVSETVPSNAPFSDILIGSSVMNLIKFGTIVFFVISGFLFQLKYDKYRKAFKPFLSNKYNALLKPYIIIFIFPLLFLYLVVPVIKNGTLGSFAQQLTLIFNTIMLTSYWFIPTLMLYFIINFFIPTKWVSTLLIIFSIITGVFVLNIYLRFLPFTNHSLTGIGFMSFFLLGRLLFLKPQLSLSRNNVSILLVEIVAFFAFSELESLYLLFSRHDSDYLNSLRLSNIFFSLAVLEGMNGLFTRKKHSLLPQVNTYFIYLIHPHFVTLCLGKTHMLSVVYTQFGANILTVVASVFVCLLLLLGIERLSRWDLLRGYSLQKVLFESGKSKLRGNAS